MLVGIGLAVLLAFAWPRRRAAEPVDPRPAPSQMSAVEPLVGEKILSHYAESNSTPHQDLTLLSHLLDNFRLGAKGEALPLGSNAEMAAALRGEGRVKLALLPPGHRAFDAAGRLIDRWGTPLFFHVESADRIAIRSAGPDREMWTADDLQRNPDGHFRTAAELNPPSLMPPSPF